MKKLCNKRNLIIVIFCLLFVCVMYYIFNSRTYASDNYNVVNLKEIKLNKDVVIEQDFIPNKNYSSIGFLASNNGNYIKKGYLRVYILSDGKVLKKYKINAKKICDDNYYYKYYYFKYNLKKNRSYTIRIVSSKLSSDVFIGKVSNKSRTYSVNNENKPGSLALSFAYSKKSLFFIWYFLMCVSLVLVIYMKGKDNYEKK